MSFRSFMKGVWQRLFPIKDITTALKIKPAISNEMLKAIEEWHKHYTGNAEHLEDDVISLRLEKSITREFANVVLNEMTVSISNEKLDKIYQNSVKRLNQRFQRGLATGAMVIKPLGADKVQFVSANAFIPIEYDSDGRLIKVVFPEYKKLNDNYYTRLEYHSLDYEKGLTITNTAYLSSSPNNLGRQIPLKMVEEWADLEEQIYFPLMLKPAFGYYVNPIDNTIDGSHCGVSVFDSALEKIIKADIQFGRLDWEFESGERRLDIDETAINPKGKLIARNTIANKIYRPVNVENLYEEFSPQLRQEGFIAGLEEYKREIEFDSGLAYGDLSNPQLVAKTATEVNASKQRKYNTVTAIQDNLKECLEDLVYALAFYNSMATVNYEFVCDFKDSILTDESEERKQDIQDLNLGVMRPEEYRAKWYSEDIDTAKANLPQNTEVLE